MGKCECCCALEEKFEIAVDDPHINLLDTYNLMKEMYQQQKLSVYMADCSFEDWREEIGSEKHYTYNTYLKCRDCGRIYYLSICIRGKPVYKILDEKPDKKEFMRWCRRDGKQFYEEQV